MTLAVGRFLLLSLATLAACSPTLDWREVRPDGDALVLLFPCKPDLRQRTVAIVGGERAMRLLGCDTAGLHFSLASVDADAPDRVEPLLVAMQAALSGNLGAAASPASSVPAFAPVGATPNPSSAHLDVAGHRPDGTALRAEAGFFVHGLRVYQATVLGEGLSGGEAPSTFLGSIRFQSAAASQRSPPR